MARMTFKLGDEYAVKLSMLGAKTHDIAKKAIYAGAGAVADEIRDNIEFLPDDTFRHLDWDEKFEGVPAKQKQDMRNGLGVSPIQDDKDGNWNAKVGFDGYGAKTNDFPEGVPHALLARSIESGSSVREKTPFVRPAVRAMKRKVNDIMAKIIDEETKKIMEG